MTRLLIHGDPGARSHFVATWLNNDISDAVFDVGRHTFTTFKKIHNLVDKEEITNFSGIKIRIKPTFSRLNLQLLLSLRKNTYIRIPNFTRDEYSIESFTKVYMFGKEFIQQDSVLDYSLYDYVVPFDKTFDLDELVKLYDFVNNCQPHEKEIELAKNINNINSIPLDNNHACSIAHLILQKESELNLQEKDRSWSVIDVYKNTKVDDLHQTITDLIDPKHYQTNMI